MPRYDYDDQDDDTDDQDDAHPWRQRLITWALAALGLGLGFLIPYTLYLNHQVSQRFGALQWQIPTRVYARPLLLAPGVAMDAQTLKTELDAASYRDDGSGERLGTYAREGGRYTISSRGYTDVEGKVPARRLQVSLSGGRVAAVRDADRRQNLKSARLDPARIATLYGQKQEERRLVRMEEVPELLVTGLQAVEDRDFSSHHGIDISGILRAIWVTARSGGETRQGASTLTQQLARSGLLGIGKEVTPTRKFNEILFALILEARYDKRTILEAYLNQVYMGQRGSQAIHGVAAASEFWFGRELRFAVHRTDRAADRHRQGTVVLRPAAQPGARAGPPQLGAGQAAGNRPGPGRRVEARAEPRRSASPGLPAWPRPTAFPPMSTWCAGNWRATIRKARCRARA